MIRVGVWASVAFLLVVTAGAETTERDRDKTWTALVAAAVNRGGVETKLDLSSSYVFQAKDGIYVTLTRVFKTQKRFVCLIAKDQKSTVCADWDTGKTTYSQKADAASPWKTRDAPRIDETDPDKSASGSLFAGFGSILKNGPAFSCCDKGGNLIFKKSW